MKIIYSLLSKSIVFSILLINTFQTFAQQTEISKLEKQKIEIQKNINLLNDSIIKIDSEIKKLKQNRYNKVAYDTTAIKINIRKGGKLRDKPDAYSDAILELSADEEAYVYDFENNYFKVCLGSYCGYVSDLWVEINPSINKFVKNKEAINYEKYLEQKKSELSTYEYSLLKKYGKDTYNKLKKGLYWIGMTKEMAKISLGNPKDINKTVGSWGVHEQWVYNNLFLYFENNKLTSYQK